MTDKQPEALRLAALLEKTGAQGSLRDEAASELRLLHAENESLLTERERNLDSIRVNNEIINKKNAELETLRAKLKTYEDLGDAGSDVQLLRMGYAAARLEIESLNAQLHAAKQINAAQFGMLAASIPGSALRASHGQAPAQPVSTMIGEQAELRRLSGCCPELNLSNYGPDDVDELNGWAIEVSQCIDRALAAQEVK